jgi:hypothetical protein
MNLCQRTNALWKPGQPIAGVFCSYAYRGKIPCTGTLRCHLCGKEIAP